MKIWDLPTRLYHWIQAALFAGLAISGLTEEGPHVTLGLMLFTLLLWRIIWGFIGSETSRFTQFIHSPGTVILYIQGKYPEKPGHNPAGGYMVIALILSLLTQCVTGLALSGMLDPLPGSEIWLNDDIFDTCVIIHENLPNGLFALVALHLTAIVIYKLLSKPLVLAMISGKQEKQSGKVTFAPTRRALVLFLICASVSALIYMNSME